MISLVERLRVTVGGFTPDPIYIEAADTIEELLGALEYARGQIVNLAVSGTDRINEVCDRLKKTDPSPIWPIPFPDPPERTWQPLVRRIDAAISKATQP